MKKLLALILGAVIFSCTLCAGSAGATTQKERTPNTYIATESSYSFSKGTVYKNAKCDLLYQKKNSKKSIKLVNGSKTPVQSFYVRGDRAYYTICTDSGSFKMYSIDLKGKNRKLLFSKYKHVLVGGYGKKQVVDLGNRGAVVSNKKAAVVKSFIGNQYMMVFNGTIFTNRQSYNIETGKKKTFESYDNLTSQDGKYLYYINKNGNLKRLDKNGNRVIIEKKVYMANKNSAQILYAKGEKVVYSIEPGYKQSQTNISHKSGIVYYKSGVKGKAYRLCSYDEFIDAFKIAKAKLAERIIDIMDVTCIKGYVYLHIRSMPDVDRETNINMIVRVKPQEGKVVNIYEKEAFTISMRNVNGELFYDSNTDRL